MYDHDSSAGMHSTSRSPGAKRAAKAAPAAKPKNEAFYVKKRGMMRKADQINKFCNADVFFFIYTRDT